METAAHSIAQSRALAIADLSTEIDGEPRVSAYRLAEALGFARIYKIGELIERHMAALTRFAEVFPTVGKTSPTGGRPGKTYWLTKRQALYLCTKAETPNATEVTIQMVEVFDAWTEGAHTPRQPERRDAKLRPAPGVATAQIGQREVCVDLADMWIGPSDEALVIDHLGRLVIVEGPLASDGGRLWLGPRAVYGPLKPSRAAGVQSRSLLALVGRVIQHGEPRRKATALPA